MLCAQIDDNRNTSFAAAQSHLPSHLQQGCLLLERATNKDFLRFYAMLGKGNGLIDNKLIAVNLMCITTEWFLKDFYFVTGNNH